MKKLVLVFMMMISVTSFAKETEKETKTLENTIQPYVEKLLKTAEQGVEWGADQIPDIVRQYVLFNSVSKGVTIIFGIFVLIYVRKIACKLCGAETYNGAYNNDTEIGYIVIHIGGYILGLCLVLLNISSFIKATFFPKLFLIEKFIGLF